MNKHVLKVEKRLVLGSKVRKMRKQGLVPATVFGKTTESASVQVGAVDFNRVYKQAGETSVVWLSLEGESKERPTLIKSMSKDPRTGKIVHIDFHQVNLKEKVNANVPVEIMGESQLIKDGLAVLDINLHEIEVEALPTDIPENITFDISTLLEIGDNLKISDIKISPEVTIITDPEKIVVALGAPQKEEEPLETEVVEAEVAGEAPVEGEAKDGEKPAEEPKAE